MKAAFGHCSYGSAKEAYESKKDSVIVLNPYGLKMVKDNVIAGSIISIFLDVPEDILVERLHTRGDTEDEIVRRPEHDRIDLLICLRFVITQYQSQAKRQKRKF